MSTQRLVTVLVVAIGGLCSESAICQIRNTDVKHDGLSGKVRTVLNESAKLSHRDGKLSEGRRTFVSRWTYESDGMVVEELVGRSYRLYRYDAAGNRYEKRGTQALSWPPTVEDFHYQQESTPDGASLYKWVSRYDSAGNRIEETIFSGVRGPHARYRYKYDDKGRRIDVIHEVQGSPARRFAYSYDASGAIKERLEYRAADSSPIMRLQDFQFDSTGNWIKCTSFELRKKGGKKDFEPVEVQYRTITYY